VPPDLDAERLDELFNLYQANRRALRAYRPGRFGGRLTLIRAAVSAAAFPAIDQEWSALAEGGAEVHVLPGDHYSLLRPPEVGSLAGLLEASTGRFLRSNETPLRIASIE